MTPPTLTSPSLLDTQGGSAESAPRPQSSGGRTLIAKLAEIMAAVDRVPKRGNNEHFRYRYAMEADITSAIRKHMSSRQIMMLPNIESVTKDGKLTSVKMTFTFFDGESGEQLTIGWAGVGEDSSDKGLWKALTGAIKYVLAKTFLIPTGDDPEATDGDGHGTNKPPQNRQPRQPDPTPADDTRVITAEQVRTIKGLLRTHNTNIDEFKTWVGRRFHVQESNKIQRKDYAAITRYITEGVDMEAV